MEALSDLQKGGTSAFAPGGAGGQKFTFVLHIGEDATVGTNKTNVLIVPAAGTITKVYAYAKVAPVGASLLLDINKNGSTIWATQGNRLTITSGANSGSQTVFDTAALAEGDLLTIDVDQVGSSTPGQEITVTLVAL